MTSSTSAAPMPVPSGMAGEASDRRSGCSRTGNRTKWLFAIAALLGLAGLAVGSIWLGFAAMLPLLYTLPCLLMLVMCMRQGTGPTSGTGTTQQD